MMGDGGCLPAEGEATKKGCSGRRERERAEGSAMIRKEKEESLGKIPYYEFICLNLGVLSSDYYG